ncbi:single-stranded-DNA-specific exonuclease RecJ [uncultured Adlercreutzia sp.]|uniref:single-stranded-DNA-specific exonuclease RecJ n=2 Tax=uncultured Adlercreutzia sp. TaxID=875803 RepID=UPI0026196175|nr:single-stranded-DNA-specific exonuclease RecJ [uncultured Adlercreutzia sp.]MCI9262594.1 single-stranded-DNA-specific exonuclease RecJ [Eggerthellaceae bacterium]
MTAQFSIREASPEAVARLQNALGLPRFIAATLVGRGIASPEEVRDFLHPSLDRDWRSPLEIPGLSAVADGLQAAMEAKKRIVVFGDFDLDGISATTVLTRGLRALGACAHPFIPHRFEEGYGITAAAFERVRQLEPDVIVTVDCGIACKHEVAAIVEQGVEVYITDHHEASDLVPENVCVADPKMGEGCPSSILAGVGVALKLVQMLGSRMGFPHLWRSYTDFATLGTVADLMPMRDENRALVADGLARMNENPRPCIAALLATTGQAGKQLTATNLSFSLIPRLNAAGRMGNADLALNLLMSDNYAECCTMAEELEAVNNQRRAIEAELSDIAKAQASENYHGQRALVVAGEGWHEGVKGIVASRLVNTYGVPSLLFTIDGDEARGSGRSVGDVNLFEAVSSLADLTTRFGGHGAAVGVTVPTKNLPEFAERLDAYMASLPEAAFHPLTEVDACVDLDELNLDTVAMVDQLAPFGQENPQPVYLARNVTLVNTRAVGQTKDHFACTLTNGRSSIAGIMFHCAAIDALLVNDAVVDAAFTVQIDEWRGRHSVKAMLETIAPARSCCALEACLDPQAVNFFTDLFAASDEDLCAPRFDEEASSAVPDRAALRAQWEERGRRDPDGLEEAIIAAIIGDRSLHPAQRQVLDQLRAGHSTFAVMATGRGKSLCFQVYAAWQALTSHKASLFIYPLRALIADQAFHLCASLEQFGLVSVVVTGESTPEERAAAYQGLADGSVDIVLTTPEYLMFHVDEFAASGRIGFVVVDEAHHIGQAKAGQRVAYTQLGHALGRLGAPVVLATTATANDAIAADIDATLPVRERVIDETSRDNLFLDDQRNIRHKDDYLATLIAAGEKTVVYVNSREQSVALARQLRRRVPQLACMIGFYNAGLSREERKRVEELFRRNDLKVLVATSAFGEGVNIPDIRHVVLYHLPFNEVEFNQMSGRAGRDGNPAWVHLLYGRSDVSLNERILAEETPDHDVMAQVYRRLRALQRQAPNDYFPVAEMDLAQLASDAFRAVSPSAAACGVAVFRELGLIETRTVYEAGRPVLWVRVREGAAKVELTDSVRYREGLDERSIFGGFRDWALGSDAQGLIVRLSHPIVPRRPHP